MDEHLDITNFGEDQLKMDKKLRWIVQPLVFKYEVKMNMGKT
jgi:hypothetical protein